MVEAVGSGVNYSAVIPAQPAGTSVQYCITTSTVDLSQVVTVRKHRFSYPGNYYQYSLRGGSRRNAYSNRNAATNADCNRNADATTRDL